MSSLFRNKGLGSKETDVLCHDRWWGQTQTFGIKQVHKRQIYTVKRLPSWCCVCLNFFCCLNWFNQNCLNLLNCFAQHFSWNSLCLIVAFVLFITFKLNLFGMLQILKHHHILQCRSCCCCCFFFLEVIKLNSFILQIYR